MKKATVSLVFVVIVVVILAGVVLLAVLGGFKKFGSESFFMGACIGDIEGERCEQDRCPARAGSDVIGIAAPLCTTIPISDTTPIQQEQACLTKYSAIIKGEQSQPICLWFDTGPRSSTGSVNCLMNPSLSCEDFSGLTVLKCEEIPGCEAKSAVELLVMRFFAGLKV